MKLSIKETMNGRIRHDEEQKYWDSQPTLQFTSLEIGEMERRTNDQIRYNIEKGAIKGPRIDSSWRQGYASLELKIRQGTKTRIPAWGRIDPRRNSICEPIDVNKDPIVPDSMYEHMCKTMEDARKRGNRTPPSWMRADSSEKRIADLIEV